MFYDGMTQRDNIQSFQSEVESQTLSSSGSVTFAAVDCQAGRWIIFGFACMTLLDQPVLFKLRSNATGSFQDITSPVAMATTIQNEKDAARFFAVDVNELPNRTTQVAMHAALTGAGPLTVATWYTQTDDYPRRSGGFDPSRITALLSE